jgi:hypothetical protein
MEGRPFVVNGRPGMPASIPSELTPWPGPVWPLAICPTCALWGWRRALAKEHAVQIGSGSSAKDGGTLWKIAGFNPFIQVGKTFMIRLLVQK